MTWRGIKALLVLYEGHDYKNIITLLIYRHISCTVLKRISASKVRITPVGPLISSNLCKTEGTAKGFELCAKVTAYKGSERQAELNSHSPDHALYMGHFQEEFAGFPKSEAPNLSFWVEIYLVVV